MNTLRRLVRLQTPQLPEKSGGCFVKKGEFIMQKKSKDTEKNIAKPSINSDEKEQNQKIKPRSKWLKILIYISNKLLYLGLNIFVYFVNRGLFALSCLASFNIILLSFVCLEWWLYHYFTTQIIPIYLQKIF